MLSKFTPAVNKHPNTVHSGLRRAPPAIMMHPGNSIGQLIVYPDIRSPICMPYLHAILKEQISNFTLFLFSAAPLFISILYADNRISNMVVDRIQV